jgi:archaemetzincin
MAKKTKKLKIKIQPLGYVNKPAVEFLRSTLSNIFGDVEVLKPLPHNEFCYDRFRRKYISTCLLKSFDVDDVTLFVTEHDLFADMMNFVFGEAELNGKRAIISLYRLKPEFYGSKDDDLFFQRVLKEAVHELGHVLGLVHCKNPKCVMHFSNSILDTDFKEWRYCDDCMKKLSKLGMEVNFSKI